MADEHQNHEPESLETVKMSREEMEREENAKHDEHGAGHDIPGNHEGRFGDTWDAEISIPGVVWVTVAIAVVTAFFFVWGWVLYGGISEDVKRDVAPQPVTQSPEPSLPPGPLLQADPEEELKEMRSELNARLGQLEDEEEREKLAYMAYGWVDESRDIVHVPIEQAIALVAERGLDFVSSASGAGTGEAVGEAEQDAVDEDSAGAPATEEAGTP